MHRAQVAGRRLQLPGAAAAAGGWGRGERRGGSLATAFINEM